MPGRGPRPSEKERGHLSYRPVNGRERENGILTGQKHSSGGRSTRRGAPTGNPPARPGPACGALQARRTGAPWRPKQGGLRTKADTRSSQARSPHEEYMTEDGQMPHCWKGGREGCSQPDLPSRGSIGSRVVGPPKIHRPTVRRQKSSEGAPTPEECSEGIGGGGGVEGL